VAADAQSRLYGNANPALTYVVGGSGLINGDTLVGAQATMATTTSSVGAYAVTQGTLAASSNYALTYVGANLTVTAAALTVTAGSQSRSYGAGNPTLSYASSGLVNGDTFSGVLATAAASTSNVGSYGITQGTLMASSNYTLAYVGSNLTVTAAPLAVTVDAQSRVYGAANPGLTYVSSGLVNGDMLSGLLTTTANTTSTVGAYAITQGTLANSNYSIAYTGASLAVTAALLTVTADARSKIYGNANLTLTYVSSGLVNGDILSGGLAVTANMTSNVGAYAVTQGTLANSNYSIAYTSANLTVTARPITVTADPQSRTYGTANPSLTYVIGGPGLANGDTLSGLLSTTATTISGIGAYAITQGALAASSNYTLTNFTGANLTVTAALLVSAAPIALAANAQSAAFPSYFSPNAFIADGSESATSGPDADESICTPAGVMRNLNRNGRVDLTGGSAASCKRSFMQTR
jgi:hypothetical protein